MSLKPGLLPEPSYVAPQPTQLPARRSRWLYAVIVALAFGYFTLDGYRTPQRTGDRPHCRDFSKASRTRVPSGTGNPAYLIKASNGAVASENEMCSRMGVDIMKAGGNAVDAAVSTTLCIGVVNMFS